MKTAFEKRDAHQYNGNVLIQQRKAQNQIEEASLYESYIKREDFANKNFNIGSRNRHWERNCSAPRCQDTFLKKLSYVTLSFIENFYPHNHRLKIIPSPGAGASRFRFRRASPDLDSRALRRSLATKRCLRVLLRIASAQSKGLQACHS